MVPANEEGRTDVHWWLSHTRGRQIGRRVLLPVLAVAALASAAGSADLNVVETVQMDFGAVLDQNGSLTLGINDNLVADPAGIRAGGVLLSGRFLITGDPFAAFSLDLVGSELDGLGIADFNTSSGQPPVLNAVLNGLGQLTIRFGAVLTVQAARAEPGLDRLLAYTISVNYN